MLFLGAGASASFGVPTLQKLTEDCELLLLERGFPPKTLTELKTSHIEWGMVPDFESLLTILQVLASPLEGIRTAGPLAAYLAHFSSSWVPQRKNIAEDIVEIKRMLTDKCSKVNITEAIKHYDRLFSMFREVQSVRFGPNSTGNLQGGAFLKSKGANVRTQDIVTTNYDLIIERYFDHDGMRQSLRTGFVPQGMRMIWDPEEGYQWGPQASATNLVKLHGSIDQFFTTAGIEKRQAPPSEGYYTSQALEEMMIFPTHEKYVTRSPYYDLFNQFRSRLMYEDVCVVIGYSFRDEAVNNAFIDAIKTRNNLKIIYVGGKNAAEDIQRVPEVAPKTKVIPLGFGVHDECVNQIKLALEQWYPD